MAYMSQEKKAALAPAIKAVLKKYDVKGSIAVRHHSTLVVNIQSGSLEFPQQDIERTQINHHWICNREESKSKQFLLELHDAMMAANHDNSDSMTDYFDVGWYISINIGKWDKPYVLTK